MSIGTAERTDILLRDVLILSGMPVRLIYRGMFR